MSVRLSLLCVFLSLELHNSKRERERKKKRKVVSVGHSLTIFYIPHDETLAPAYERSAQGGSCVWRLSAPLIHTCARMQKHTHPRTAGSEAAMYGFDPDPTHLNAAPCAAVRGVVLVIHKKHNHIQGWMCFLYTCGGVWDLWFNLPSTAECAF